jgi:competence protein ComEC
MYRPFLFIVVFLIPGIVTAGFITAPGFFLFLASASLVVCLAVGERKKRVVLAAVFIFFFGAYYFGYRAEKASGTIINYAGSQQTIVGVVCDVPEVEADKITYDIKTLYLVHGNTYQTVSGKLRLSVLRDFKRNMAFDYGDLVKFSGKLKLPQVKRNPGGMDYRAYLLQKGISATMFSKQAEKLGVYRANPFIKAAYFLRERLTAFYNKNLPHDLSALLAGIVIGIKGSMPKETLRAFSDAGVIHVLAVSGLNVAVIYGVLQRVFDIFYVHRLFSFIVGSFAIIFYSFMAGLSPSVIRAAVMVGILMLGRVAGRESDPLNSLCLAAVVLLLLNPLNLYSISFQLSFSATLGIILFYNTFQRLLSKLPGFLRDSLAVVLSAQLMVWPFSAYYFHRVSLISFVSNLAVVPLVSLVLLLGFVAGLLGMLLLPVGVVVVKMAGAILLVVDRLTLFFSKLPGAALVVPEFPPAVFVFYFLSLALIFDMPSGTFSIKGKLKKTAAAVLLSVTVLLIVPMNTGLEVTFIDVGQGDSIFIKTPGGKTVLIDGGGMQPYYTGDFDVGRDVVEPFLHGRGIDRIDLAVFTHFDDDHARGLLSILEDMKVEAVMYGMPDNSDIYNKMKEIARQKKIKILQTARGDRFNFGGAVFEVLNPPRNAKFTNSDNDNSVVLKMAYGGISFLFTGDLGFYGERDLIDSGCDLRAVVLKAGHHGSATSTSEEFLSRVRPAIAVISVGRDNSFGHPSARVLDLLKKYDVKVLRTDLQGAITFKVVGKNVKIFTSILEEM